MKQDKHHLKVMFSDQNKVYCLKNINRLDLNYSIHDLQKHNEDKMFYVLNCFMFLN